MIDTELNLRGFVSSGEISRLIRIARVFAQVHSKPARTE